MFSNSSSGHGKSFSVSAWEYKATHKKYGNFFSNEVYREIKRPCKKNTELRSGKKSTHFLFICSAMLDFPEETHAGLPLMGVYSTGISCKGLPI
jgi:hypothetical protein